MICTYCRKKFPDNIMVYDHFIPKSKGGSDSKKNFVLACFYCNSAKRNKVFKTRKDFLKFQEQRIEAAEWDEKNRKKLNEPIKKGGCK